MGLGPWATRTRTGQLVEQSARWYLDGGRKFFDGRRLRVVIVVLDPADLTRLDATALGGLFLGQAELCRGRP
jgi:hypothetical protein